jgi:hypothetical protein
LEALKDRPGRKMLATQESLNTHPNLRQAMAPPNLDQAALEVLPRLQEAPSSRRTVTAEQTAMQVSECCDCV